MTANEGLIEEMEDNLAYNASHFGQWIGMESRTGTITCDDPDCQECAEIRERGQG